MTDNIIFSDNPGADLAGFLKEKKYSKIAVVADDNTLEHCYPLIQEMLPSHETIQVPPGEEYKHIKSCEMIWRKMTDQALDRHSALIIIGGGVLGDMGGFCAATYKRGIDFVLIPTTLLSQVDASIGGKLGIDFEHFKNHIGVFKTPALTILHSGFLKTLPDEERRSGFAEVIKHALIADLPMWEIIRKKALHEQSWDVLLKHSVNIKLKVVASDPYENGLRKTLNAGHTIGHALETYLLNVNRKVLHGEAVAAGLVCEGFLALEKGMLSKDAFDGIHRYIDSTFGKVRFKEEEEKEIVSLTAQDKKNKGNKVLCVLLDGIGKARWDCEVRPEEVKRALSFYRSA